MEKYINSKKGKEKQVIIAIMSFIFIAIIFAATASKAGKNMETSGDGELPTSDKVEASKYFPLAVGNEWTYEGTVAYTLANSNKVIEKKVKLTMSVKDVVKNGDIYLYIMSGHPSNAAAVGGEHKEDLITVSPEKYGYLLVANKIYRIDKYDLDKAIQCLKGDGYLSDITLGLTYEFPLFKGLRIGDISYITRPDLRYFWYVNEKYNLSIPEAGTMRTVSEYQIVYRTGPDHQEIVFRPYLGIQSYKYSHHGTIAEVNVTLTDYKINTNK